jgi:signal transduction histidine kinase
LVDLSKVETGSLVIHKTVVRLMEICYKARESVKNEVQPGLKLLHQYPVVLKDTRIYTDGRRMVQLLRNILSNACKHTRMGAITLRVRTVESDDSQGQPRLQIRVSDTGEGIPVENRSQLFLPFRKFDGVTEGLGMGLAISRQIAKMLGGRLYLDEDYEGGSSFVYEMPFEEA